MARAQKFQDSGVRVGQITHKPLEKGAGRKEREETKPEPRTVPKKGTPRRGSSEKRASKSTSARDSRPGAIQRERPSGPRPSKESEQKVKKAVTATTGYTGTARPKPDDGRKSKVPRGGAVLDPRPRYGSGGRGSRYDEEDEELDDFIEYDDDEDGPDQRGRYDYDSDGSSDMEAGLGDIDEEEERAAMLARREDLIEERAEAARKKEKEERKRLAMLEMRRSGRA